MERSRCGAHQPTSARPTLPSPTNQPAGRLPSIARNVLTAVFMFDPASPAALEMGAVAYQMENQVRAFVLPCCCMPPPAAPSTQADSASVQHLLTPAPSNGTCCHQLTVCVLVRPAAVAGLARAAGPGGGRARSRGARARRRRWVAAPPGFATMRGGQALALVCLGEQIPGLRPDSHKALLPTHVLVLSHAAPSPHSPI